MFNLLKILLIPAFQVGPYHSYFNPNKKITVEKNLKEVKKSDNMFFHRRVGDELFGFHIEDIIFSGEVCDSQDIEHWPWLSYA